MIKKTITYNDYDGNTWTEDFFFNLSKSELMEMNFSESGGMEKMIRHIIDTKDIKKIIEVIKTIILSAYGEKSADGKRFIKVRDGRRLSEDFEQSEAYSELFMELSSNEDAASEFIKGVIPKDLSEEVSKQETLSITK